MLHLEKISAGENKFQLASTLGFHFLTVMSTRYVGVSFYSRGTIAQDLLRGDAIAKKSEKARFLEVF